VAVSNACQCSREVEGEGQKVPDFIARKNNAFKIPRYKKTRGKEKDIVRGLGRRKGKGKCKTIENGMNLTQSMNANARMER